MVELALVFFGDIDPPLSEGCDKPSDCEQYSRVKPITTHFRAASSEIIPPPKPMRDSIPIRLSIVGAWLS